MPGEAAVGHHAPGRRVVPVRAVGGRRLAHGHLRHGPDLWLAGDGCTLLLFVITHTTCCPQSSPGRDGDALLAVVLVPGLAAVAEPVVAELLPPQLLLPVCSSCD